MSPSGLASWVVLCVKAFCATVIFFATVFSVYTVGPAIETRFWPAVSKLLIVNLSEDDHGNSVVMAQFTKIRDCEYLGIAWFRGMPEGGFERVPVTLLRKPGDTSSPNRPTGTQKAGPWIVAMSPDQLRVNSFARLTHRCHPFWITTTEFWP